MKCNEALLLIDSVIDGESTPEQDQLLRFHLNGCTSCRKVMLLNKTIAEKVKELDEPMPPVNLTDIVRARLTSGNFDKSPIHKKTPGLKKLSAWRVAAVIPFAAALVFLLQNFSGEHASSFGATRVEPASSEVTDTQYTPAPIVAYSRPSSVSTF